MHNFKDLTGQRFGNLTVIQNTMTKAKSGNYIWECKCDCGVVCNIQGGNLTCGCTQSCGCKKVIQSGKNNIKFKHGKQKHPLYQIWKGMKARCNNPNHVSYKNYGGRGITMCNRWSENFEHFLNDMGERPGPEYSIDRIDNDRGYEPGNCRWATMLTQNRNHTNHITYNINGKLLYLWEIANLYNLSYDIVYSRHYKGYPIEDIIKPVNSIFRSIN